MKPPTPLLILATSGSRGEVGVLRPEGTLDTVLLGEGAARGRGLQPAIASQVPTRSLGGIVVDRGPGSFTGVRVGVTAAKSLAFALGVPVWGVTSLEAIAGSEPGTVLAIRDAGRGEVYAGLFDGGKLLRPLWRAPKADVLAEAAGAKIRDEDAGAEAVLRALRTADAREATPPHALCPLYLQVSAAERRSG